MDCFSLELTVDEEEEQESDTSVSEQVSYKIHEITKIYENI